MLAIITLGKQKFIFEILVRISLRTPFSPPCCHLPRSPFEPSSNRENLFSISSEVIFTVAYFHVFVNDSVFPIKPSICQAFFAYLVFLETYYYLAVL